VTKQITGTTNYYYLGSTHKLPTKIERINTDGSTDRSYIKYTKDYILANDDMDDQAMGAIKGLTLQNVNIPIEKYYTLTRAGVEKTMKADLVKFAAFSSGLTTPLSIYMPAQQLSVISSAGISSFPVSYNNSGTFTNYSGYTTRANLTDYNGSGSLLTGDDNYKNVKSQIVDDKTLLPVASIANARYNEVSYSNFDGSEPKYGLAIGGTGATYSTPMSISGVYSLAFPSSATLTDTLALKPGAKRYVYSCWINSTSSGVLTVSLYNSTGTLFGSQTINFTSGTRFLYYEQLLNTNGITGTFSIKVQTNTSMNIDDILFYPENAKVAVSAYDPKTLLKNAEGNTNGVYKYYGYDQYDRLKYVFDQDYNIVTKNTYASANTIANSLTSSSFTYSPSNIVNVGNSVTFTGVFGSNTCTPGTYYSWNFGDGTAPTTPSLTNSNPTHTYTTAGKYTVSYIVSNPIFGSKTVTQDIPVYYLVNGCQSGVYGFTPPNGAVLTQSCSTYPNNTSNSYFTITGITGAPAGTTFTYTWQIYYYSGVDSLTWTTLTTGITTSPPELTVPFVKSTFRAYDIRCNVTSTIGGVSMTARSPIFSVSVGGS
jgi:hypothetical protein